LILGRFTVERKLVLDTLKEQLRTRNYLPIVFDFDVPKSRDTTETVTLLARISRFVLADLTDPKSVPKELEAIVPQIAVPVIPLIELQQQPYSMFNDYWKYDWVLQLCRYENLEDLRRLLDEIIIPTAELKARELEAKRAAV